MSKQITLPEMWSLYEEGLIYDIVSIGARTYAKKVACRDDEAEIVYAMG